MNSAWSFLGWTTGSLLVVSGLSSCISTEPGVRPDDMSAAAHEEVAAREEAQAAAAARRYNANAQATRGGGVMEPGVAYNPTGNERTLSQAHQRHAVQHHASAAALRRFEDEQCVGLAPEARAACPFLGGHVARVEDISGGVRLVLPADANPDALFRVLSCHAAFARARHQTTVDDCAPYVPQVTVQKSADGRAVLLTTPLPANVKELRRRAAAQVSPPAS